MGSEEIPEITKEEITALKQNKNQRLPGENGIIIK